MESDIMPLHSSSPPPLDDEGDCEAVSEEDEFGDFGTFSHGFADSSDSTSRLSQPPPTLTPATHQSSCSLHHLVKQSQPTSAVNSGSSRARIDVGGQGHNTKSYVHLTNGHSESDHPASAVGVSPPMEETGFADFTLFTEQAAHPWCCGFTPLDSTEKWDGRAVGANSSARLGEQMCDSGQGVIMDSEPRPHCAHEAKENVCTMAKHCEKRDAALTLSSQDHHHPQDTVAALVFASEEPHFVEDSGKPGDSQGCRRRSFNSLKTTQVQEDGESEEDREDQEKSISAVPQTFSVYECVSEELASFSDDFSFEGPSADLEPNVSSLGSEDQTEWDQTDEEEEEPGNSLHSDSFVNNSMANLTSKGLHYCNQSVTQETSATSNPSQPRTRAEGNFADFKDRSLEHHRDPEHAETADGGVQCLGNLPPSDSFADFCSAPMPEVGQDSWAEFKELKAQETGRTWTQSREQVSSLQMDGDAEEEDREGKHGLSRRNSCQASLSCRVQQLLLASFPDVEVPEAEGEEEEEEGVLSLGVLLHAQNPPESEEEGRPELSPTPQWTQLGMWWPHQDLHSALGLQFQWGGSHTNMTLLRCLGVDTRNIVFVGVKKQPVAVPAFASSLGMLEPTKDSVPGTAQAPQGPQDTPAPSSHVLQEALPSSQLDWSSRGLSSSQDAPQPLSPLVSTGCSALNLDYFGPEEEEVSSCSSSSRSSSPPPGIDRELYELTISKMETGTSSSQVEDTLHRLMSTAEKTSTPVRKPQQDDELSAEAGRVICGLPSLSFMQAKVLMFPSVFVPSEAVP